MSSTSAPLLPNATIVDRSDLTESIACFRIRSDAAPVAFVPGQYVTVGLGVDERLVQRPYSIASSARRVDDRTHLFVATGCGLAPFMSMLRTLDDDRAPRRVVVVHGVSYADELGYRSELERWAEDPDWSLRYVPTISRPGDPRNAGWT